MNAKRILAIDADTLFLDLLVHVLKSDSVIVLTASSIATAKKHFDLHQPEIVIVDPSMPGILDFIRYMRSSEISVTALALGGTGHDAPPEIHGLGIEMIVDRGRGITPLLSAVRTCLEQGPENDSPNEQVTVLVVDDEPDMCNMLEDFLSRQGYRVVTAACAREAYEAMEANPLLSVVLLDIMLPDEGGLSLLRALMQRKHPPGVIMMTAIADRQIAQQAMHLGAFDYVAKSALALDSLDDLVLACATRVEYQRKWWDYELDSLRQRAGAWMRSLMDHSEMLA
jgi:DNA-binding NtrC family response regulator